MMDDHYEQIKEDVRLSEELNASGMEKANDMAYKQLTPGAPYLFRELISKDGFDPKRFIKHQRHHDRLSGGAKTRLMEDHSKIKEAML